MAFDTTDFRDAFRLAAYELKRREDERDFKDEMAGHDTGKMARFLSAEHHEERRHPRSGESRKAESVSRLQMLLASNPAYARLYQKTFDTLGNAENAAEAALAKLEAAHQKARQELQDILDHAARLPDGRRVFKDKQGQVWDEHGARVEDTEAAAIHWRGSEPTREDFARKAETAERLGDAIDDIKRGQVEVLGKYREELTDDSNPPSSSRMEEMDEGIQTFRRDVESTLRQNGLATDVSASAPIVNQAAPDTIRPL